MKKRCVESSRLVGVDLTSETTRSVSSLFLFRILALSPPFPAVHTWSALALCASYPQLPVPQMKDKTSSSWAEEGGPGMLSE